MKLIATAIVTLFATVALAQGTATAPTAPATAPVAPAAGTAMPPMKGGAHAKMDKEKTCEGKAGAELKKCEDEAKKAHHHSH